MLLKEEIVEKLREEIQSTEESIMHYEGSEKTLLQPFSFTGNRLCREVVDAPSHSR